MGEEPVGQGGVQGDKHAVEVSPDRGVAELPDLAFCGLEEGAPGSEDPKQPPWVGQVSELPAAVQPHPHREPVRPLQEIPTQSFYVSQTRASPAGWGTFKQGARLRVQKHMGGQDPRNKT